jgi:hypothetical protein
MALLLIQCIGQSLMGVFNVSPFSHHHGVDFIQNLTYMSFSNCYFKDALKHLSLNLIGQGEVLGEIS